MSNIDTMQSNSDFSNLNEGQNMTTISNNLNEQLFQELDNEIAENCNGGAAYLYEHDGFRGRKLTFYQRTSNLRRWGFNDKTSSIKITAREKWAFYKDVGYNKLLRVLDGGKYGKSYSLSTLRALGIPNDSISSLKRI